MKNRLSLSIIIMSFTFLTCDDNIKDDAFPDLRKFLRRFEDEAKRLGYDVDLSKVQAEYVDNIVKQGKKYCGWGYNNYDGNGLQRIEISKSCSWASWDDTAKENLVFHEIGHAFLSRPHDRTKRCDGSSLSLMDDTGGVNIYIEGEAANRTYYISELLDKSVGAAQCIKYDKNFTTDPVFFRNSSQDAEWIFSSSNGKYGGQRSEALTISGPADNSATENGYWFRQFAAPNIPECAEVTLRMTLSSTNLTGKGVGIAVRVYESLLQKQGAFSNQYMLLTTEEQPLTGVINNVTQDLTIPCFSRKTTYLLIFGAMLAGTTGDVTFKNIEILVRPK